MRRGLVAPQNTFLENILRRSSELDANFVVGNASLSHQPIIYCSDTFITATGYSKRDVLHKNITCNFLYGKLTNREDLSKIEACVDSKNELQLEIIFYKKNKTPAWFLLHIAPINDEKNQVVLFLLTFRDITHLKDPIEHCNLRKWSRLVKKTIDKSKSQDLNSHMLNHPRSVFMQLTRKTNTKKAQISNMMSDNSDLHVNYSWEGTKMDTFTILHYATYKTIWDWIILLFTLYTAVLVPFVVCFAYKGSLAWTIFNTIIDCIFILDVIMNFRTTFINKDGELVYERKLITLHYLKGWFIVDFTAAFPYGLINFAYDNKTGPTEILGIIKVIRLIRLVRIARKLDHYFSCGASTLALWLFLFCLCAHWMACIWYVIGRHYDKPLKKWGWLHRLSSEIQMPYVYYKNGTLDETSGPTHAALYMGALYYTMSSLTTCGFGNIAPNTTAEKIFGCVTMLLGCLLYAFIFGQVTAIIQHFQNATSVYHQKLGHMKQFIKLYVVPDAIGKRLIDYFMSTWQSNKGINVEDILKSVPRDLHADISIHMHRAVFEKLPTFQKAPASVKRAIARFFWTITTAPGDRLVYNGETLDCLYFVEDGSLEIRQDEQIVGILGPSDYFGCRLGMERGYEKSMYDVLALTYADVHCITKDSLKEGLSLYPEFYDEFREQFLPTFELSDEMNMYSRCGSMHPLKDRLKGQTMTDGGLGMANNIVIHANTTDFRRQSLPFDIDPSGDFEELHGWHMLKSEVSREIERMNAKMGIVEEQISLILKLLQGKETPNKTELMNLKLVELQKYSNGDLPESSNSSETNSRPQSETVTKEDNNSPMIPIRSDMLTSDDDRVIDEIDIIKRNSKAKDFSPVVDYRPSKLKKKKSKMKGQEFEMKTASADGVLNAYFQDDEITSSKNTLEP